MQHVAIIGYLTTIHPKLTWLPKLTDDLTTAMKNTQLPQSEITAWKEQTKSDYEDTPGEIPVPNFHFSTKNYGFGSHGNRVETNLLHIHCAADDAKYLKTLLADAFVHDYMDNG
eukprot:scaffold27358_cov30-Attheya_sp.AAC.1